MSENIINLSLDYLTPFVLNKSAAQYKESKTGIKMAASVYLPLVAAMLIQKSASIPNLLSQLKDIHKRGIITGLNAETNNRDKAVLDLLSSLFGDEIANLTSIVATNADVKDNSSESILYLTAVSIFGSVGKYANQNNYTDFKLSGFLNNQKEFINLTPVKGISYQSLHLDNFSSK